MNFFELTRTRQSVRIFQERPVEAGKLDTVLETINAAPSAGNLQAFRVYVVTGVSQRASLHAAAPRQGPLLSAPVVLVFCADPARSAQKYGQRGADLFCLQDATIACTYAMLAVAAVGLHGVWIGSFDEEGVRSVIAAPDNIRPIAMLAIGYAAEIPPPRPRRPISDIIFRVEA